MGRFCSYVDSRLWDCWISSECFEVFRGIGGVAVSWVWVKIRPRREGVGGLQRISLFRDFVCLSEFSGCMAQGLRIFRGFWYVYNWIRWEFVFKTSGFRYFGWFVSE